MESSANPNTLEIRQSISDEQQGKEWKKERSKSRIFGVPVKGAEQPPDIPTSKQASEQPSQNQPHNSKFRKLHVNCTGVQHLEKNKLSKFPDNSISTTKYTPLTFLPKNLFEQFKRLANFYFLVIALIQVSDNNISKQLQLIPGLTNINPVGSIAPLIFVLTVSAVKEAIEDLVDVCLSSLINCRQDIDKIPRQMTV